MSKVFVVDSHKKPLDPIHPGRARLLLKQGKAAVWRQFPFTIILHQTIEQARVVPLRLKLDPGSRTTGLALLNDANGEVVFAAELTHRGHAIKAALDKRRGIRRSRRQRNTRYRKPRFRNRRRKQGWLSPSLESRIANILTWVARLRRLCRIEALSMELVRFDMQRLEQADVSGVQYQHGELFHYEVREYLLEKFERTCVYCGAKEVPLQVEHVVARAKGGTNRISNLVLACVPCNQRKGNLDLAVFLEQTPDVLKRVQGQLKRPLKDTAAVNMTRWALFERLTATGLPVETGSGGLSKYNRSVRGLSKTHWLDAVCVGRSTPQTVQVNQIVPLFITAVGHGCRRKCNVNAFGFPISKPKGAKIIKGFQTGDMVRAIVTTGSKQGTYVGRVVVRACGSFDIRTRTGRVQGLSHRFFHPVHRCDGYSYQKGTPYSTAFPRDGEKYGSASEFTHKSGYSQNLSLY